MCQLQCGKIKGENRITGYTCDKKRLIWDGLACVTMVMCMALVEIWERKRAEKWGSLACDLWSFTPTYVDSLIEKWNKVG